MKGGLPSAAEAAAGAVGDADGDGDDAIGFVEPEIDEWAGVQLRQQEHGFAPAVVAEGVAVGVGDDGAEDDDAERLPHCKRGVAPPARDCAPRGYGGVLRRDHCGGGSREPTALTSARGVLAFCASERLKQSRAFYLSIPFQ